MARIKYSAGLAEHFRPEMMQMPCTQRGLTLAANCPVFRQSPRCDCVSLRRFSSCRPPCCACAGPRRGGSRRPLPCTRATATRWASGCLAIRRRTENDLFIRHPEANQKSEISLNFLFFQNEDEHTEDQRVNQVATRSRESDSA